MHRRRRRTTSERSPRIPDRTPQSRAVHARPAVPTGAAVVLLTLVALASRGLGPERGPAPSAGGPGGTVPAAPAEYVVLIVLLVAATAMALLLVGLLRILRPRKKEEELVAARIPPPWWQAPLLLLLLAALGATAIGSLIWASRRFPSELGQSANGRPGAGGSVAPGGGGTAAPASPASWDWAPVAVVAGAAALGGFVLLLRRDRRPLPSPSARPHREEVAEAVELTIEDIRRDPDPRHAVIAAYARMEAVLARGGWPRPASAAPLEYLAAALRRLSVPAAPARTLTDLFEIARFSRHRVDATMKQDAIDALVAVRDALAVEAA
jgi:hypothetical protein